MKSEVDSPSEKTQPGRYGFMTARELNRISMPTLNSKGCPSFDVGARDQGNAHKLLKQIKSPSEIGIFRRNQFEGLEDVTVVLGDPKKINGGGIHAHSFVKNEGYLRNQRAHLDRFQAKQQFLEQGYEGPADDEEERVQPFDAGKEINNFMEGGVGPAPDEKTIKKQRIIILEKKPTCLSNLEVSIFSEKEEALAEKFVH